MSEEEQCTQSRFTLTLAAICISMLMGAMIVIVVISTQVNAVSKENRAILEKLEVMDNRRNAQYGIVRRDIKALAE